MTENKEQTLEAVITKLKYLRKDLTHLNSEVKSLKETQAIYEKMAMDMLDEQGLTAGGSDSAGATISISSEIVPHVDKEHWNEVFQYIFDNGYIEILRKQLNSGSFKELLNLGVAIPYVTPVTLRKLNMREKTK